MEDKIPVHIAIIPDGNRRWAKENGLIATAGHVKAGNFSNMSSLFNEAKRLGVKYISLWGFSTDNWKRSKDEVEIILDVISKGVIDAISEARKMGFGFKHIGRRDRLPKELLEKFDKLAQETNDFHDSFILLCIDYGGRDEIVRATNKLLKSGKKEITQEDFSNALDTAGFPDPDLIIRTGGEQRTSGFMPFQSDYSELYFIKKYFPDFDAKELRKAVKEFGKRKRRFGGN